ncbi:MAG: hypothetical protein GY711_21830 [bacterium]|nr:hypothetical protein [bacterium]
MPRTSSTLFAATLLATLSVGAWTCSQDPVAPPPGPPDVEHHPAGAILRVDAGYVYANEVDAFVETIGLIEPDESLPSLRRKALANICMPRAVARQLDPQAYERARQEVSTLYEAVLAGEGLATDGPQIEKLEGHWRSEFGMDVWGLARSETEGIWSDVHETVGGFTFFRVVSAPPSEEWDLNTRITIERVFVPYLPPEGPFLLLQQAVDQADFEVVDPAWEELVPAHFKYSRDTIRDDQD